MFLRAEQEWPEKCSQIGHIGSATYLVAQKWLIGFKPNSYFWFLCQPDVKTSIRCAEDFFLYLVL